ncbi:MAG: hypothetical protein J6K48_03045 [Lachnospiraceae bacterium]|nr:hypothetical protein [Lachnospiraceae bacterium]
MKKAISLLLVLVMVGMITGCGGSEAVHTSAEAQEEENITESDTGEENAEGGKAEENAGEESTGEDAQTDVNEEKTNATVAQVEIDEETKNELAIELLKEQEMDTSVLENTRATKGCTFTLPDTFEESEDMPGMYVTKRYPIDASTIYYVALDQDVALQLMTEETFKEQAESDFRQAYNEDIEVVIDSFERIRIDGYPAFRILCHYEVNGIEITQLEYAINADKSYVITYSQTGDYDRMEEYEASAETIRLEY